MSVPALIFSLPDIKRQSALDIPIEDVDIVDAVVF